MRYCPAPPQTLDDDVLCDNEKRISIIFTYLKDGVANLNHSVVTSHFTCSDYQNGAGKINGKIENKKRT